MGWEGLWSLCVSVSAMVVRFPLWFLNANLFEIIKYQCFTFVITMPFLS
ncbi:hypothetical protein KSS87_006376, partial [Heliosperma pusillum]